VIDALSHEDPFVVGVAIYTPVGSEADFAELLPGSFKIIAQREGGFGTRLSGATEDLYSVGFSAVCLIDSDSTGVGLRDVTPEAIRSIMRVELPGFGEVMRAGSLKLTPNAIISRCLAAIVDRSLVVALPGKPQGAVDCLGFVAAAVPQGVANAMQLATSS
jgi:molybdopterin adenylyltransferase